MKSAFRTPGYKKQKIEIFQARHIQKEITLADYMQTQLSATEDEAKAIDDELLGMQCFETPKRRNRGRTS
jgi:hypothetical protein